MRRCFPFGETPPQTMKGVEVTGLEPATAWSQTRNATNCATPRCKIQNSSSFAAAKVSIISESCKYFSDYFITPTSLNTFFSI